MAKKQISSSTKTTVSEVKGGISEEPCNNSCVIFISDLSIKSKGGNQVHIQTCNSGIYGVVVCRPMETWSVQPVVL